MFYKSFTFKMCSLFKLNCLSSYFSIDFMGNQSSLNRIFFVFFSSITFYLLSYLLYRWPFSFYLLLIFIFLCFSVFSNAYLNLI